MSGRKILICDAQVPFAQGGAESVRNAFCRRLRDAGFSVDTLLLPFQWSPKIALVQNALLWRSLQVFDAADLVIATRFPAYCVAARRKVAWLFHQHRAVYEFFDDPQYSDFRANDPQDLEIRQSIHRLDSRFLGECQARFSISRNVASRLARNNQLEAQVLYPPSPLENLRFESQEPFVFVPIRLEANKRPELLLEVMRHVRSPVRCVIGGTGAMGPALQARARALKLEEKVEFAGGLSDRQVEDLYARCLAVVYPPKDEDLGLVTLEAFQSEKPVITVPDAGGPLEFVRSGENGYVAGSAEELAERIDGWHANPGRAREMGRAGRDRLESMNIRWDHVIETLVHAN